MACWVYVLRGSNGKNYTGITDNLPRRIREHNAGRAPADRSRGPFRLIYKEELADHTTARRRENYLKSGTGRRWLKQHLADS